MKPVQAELASVRRPAILLRMVHMHLDQLPPAQRRAVVRGEDITITDGDRTVAILHPAVPDLASRMAAMAAAGEIQAPLRRHHLGTFRPVAIPGPSLADTVLEDRR